MVEGTTVYPQIPPAYVPPVVNSISRCVRLECMPIATAADNATPYGRAPFTRPVPARRARRAAWTHPFRGVCGVGDRAAQIQLLVVCAQVGRKPRDRLPALAQQGLIRVIRVFRVISDVVLLEDEDADTWWKARTNASRALAWPTGNRCVHFSADVREVNGPSCVTTA